MGGTVSPGGGGGGDNICKGILSVGDNIRGDNIYYDTGKGKVVY